MEINGIYWGLYFINRDDKLLKRKDGSKTIGMIDLNRKCIYVANDLSETMLRKVLIHELVHAYLYSYGYEMKLRDEEIMCDFVATYSDSIIYDVENILYELF